MEFAGARGTGWIRRAVLPLRDGRYADLVPRLSSHFLRALIDVNDLVRMPR